MKFEELCVEAISGGSIISISVICMIYKTKYISDNKHMFLLYINDLPLVSKKLTFFLFADDTNIYYESSDVLEIQKTVNKELKKVHKWLEANRLSLNIEKNQFCVIPPSKT